MEDKSHMLKPTRSRPFPSTLFYLDTETKLEEIGHKTKLHKLKLGICQRYDRTGAIALVQTDQIEIGSQSEFMQWFMGQMKPKAHYYLIAHNIIYDTSILDLFRLLPKARFKLDSIYSKGQVNIIRWGRGSTKITMLDNGNIFAGSLEKWGDIFKIPKIKIDFDNCNGSELSIYCKRDVDIMVSSWKSWIRFIYDNDCGGFRETVGSTSFNTWRHKYLKAGVYVHKNPNVLTLERESYHGGRVEVFHQGLLWTDHYYYLDINNMYGFIMRDFPVPTGLQGYSKRLGLRRMISYLDRYAVTARCLVNVDKPAFISSVNGHVCYPLGRFETVLTTPEIVYALSNGWIEKVKDFAWYERRNLFTDFVTDFYNLRMRYRAENNKGFEAICKLIINSLYGKFGQTGILQQIIGKARFDEVWHMPVINAQTGERGYQTALGGTIFEEWHEGESYHAMPAVAAHITANARLYLFNLIQKAGPENVYYCDTDSLIVNRMGYYNLESELDGNKLGKLKVEIQSDWLRINAPKDYEMEGRKKIKGVKSNALELDDNTYLQEQWVKLAGLVRSGFNEGYTSKEIVKHQERIIYSGVVQPGGLVEPFRLK